MMLSRLLFAVRSRVPDPIGMLGSWRLSVVLTVSAALYFGLLAIWATASPPSVVQRIARLLPFWILYCLILVNTAFCLWQRWSILVAAVKTRRWSSLGTYLFHLSFFLLAFAVGLTLLFRHETTVRVAEGESFVGAPAQIVSRSGTARIILPEKPIRFAVERVIPEFWRDQLLFTRLEATLALPGGERRTTRINRPLWFPPATFLRLSGFGDTPRYEIRDDRGKVVESLFAKLAVFPPGARDSFRLERFPHTVEVEIIPDPIEVDGRLSTRSLNLDHPVIRTRVSRGKIILAQGDLRLGEELEFEGLRLSFPEIRYWGDFSIVTDPGVPVLFASFAIALAGLILKLRPRRGIPQ